MTRLPLRPGALAVALLLAATGRAGATAADCSRVPDGTACHTECLQDGRCMGGQCMGGHAVPDGTQCATGSVCTVGDQCKEGICLPGAPLVCSPGPCGPQHCEEGVGCLADNPCDMPPYDLSQLTDGAGGPDLTDPLPPGDAATAPDAPPPADDAGPGPVDAGVPADAPLPDDAGPPAKDLAPAPDGGVDSSVPDLGSDDGGPAGDDLGGGDGGEAQADGGVDPDGGEEPDGGDPSERWIHLHGSGCTVDAQPGPAPAGLLLLLALPLLVLARRRRR